jgi:hypothetical protein
LPDASLRKMLVLAASYNNRLGHAPNALTYSWLEDLEDPEFPFSAPIQAYTDDEIRNRHETVRCQLDSLSKGLLEMRGLTLERKGQQFSHS